MTMIGGTTEGEVLRMLQDCNRKAEGCCRQLAHLRGDARWLTVGMMYAKSCEKVTQLSDRKTGRPGTLVLPPNYQRPNWQ